MQMPLDNATVQMGVGCVCEVRSGAYILPTASGLGFHNTCIAKSLSLSCVLLCTLVLMISPL